MREGRRQRLGLQEGTEGTVQDTYLDRIITDAEVAESAAGPFDYLNLGDDANVNVRDQRYVGDAYKFYLDGGFPEEPEPVIDTPVVDTTPVVDAGGGGGGQDLATGGVDLGGNTDFEQNLLDQGIGVQGAIGDSVVAPGEIPVTQQEMDDFNASAILDSESTADEISQDLSNQQAMLNPTGDNIMNEVALTGGFSEFDDLEADPGAQPTELGSRINQAFENVKNRGIEAKDSLTESFKNLGGEKITDNLFKFGDTTIDIGKSLTSGAISFIGKALTGIPGLGLIASLLPEGGRSDMSDALGEQYGMDDIGRLTGGPMAGYAVDSLMGDGIEQATIDRINSIKNRTAPQTESSEKKIEDLEEFLEQIERNKTAIDYDIEGTDEGDRAAEEAAAAQAEADRIEAERRALQKINAAAAIRSENARIAAIQTAQRQANQRSRDAGPGYGGSGTASEMGSFNKGGMVSLKNAKR